MILRNHSGRTDFIDRGNGPQYFFQKDASKEARLYAQPKLLYDKSITFHIDSNLKKRMLMSQKKINHPPKTIFYSTTNVGKFEELHRYIKNHIKMPPFELKQFDQEIPEIQSIDQKAIAINKAQKAWELCKKPVLVDDSGIYFEHYNNFPGTLSKFIFHGIGFEGLLKLTEVDNRAYLKLFMIYKENEKEHHIFEGITKGSIIRPEEFEAHPALPYDAIFLPAGSNKTMAKIRGTEEEQNFSYRIKALKKFIEFASKK